MAEEISQESKSSKSVVEVVSNTNVKWDCQARIVETKYITEGSSKSIPQKCQVETSVKIVEEEMSSKSVK